MQNLRREWTKNELVLALNLYHKIPFGLHHDNNPDVQAVARLIGRSDGSVAMKLGNFASLDPYHANRGVSGLKNASKGDRETWDMYFGKLNELANDSATALQELLSHNREENINDLELIDDSSSAPNEVTERIGAATFRIGQNFFRKMVLANYRNRCCICQLPIREMLVASHIVPWKQAETLRLAPDNGLSLCSLHDKAFDKGFLTVTPSYRIRLSSQITSKLDSPSIEFGFGIYDDKEIILPDKHRPHQDYLRYHANQVFIDKV